MNQEIKDRYIFHIPHSSISIPDFDGYIDDIDDEIIKLTDWSTNTIFDVHGIDKIISNFSRIYCDVERLYDSNEEMYSFGRGIYYTKKDNGKILRKENSKHKNFVIEEFYTKHHEKLNNLIQHKLNKYGECIIVDCHSFSNKPFQTDLIQDENRPDVCIGIDNFHTPENLKTIFVNLFKEYSVLINNPYSGTIIPEKYYKDSRVKSIMIELNRNLYMVDDKFIDTKKLILLNRLISSFFNFY